MKNFFLILMALSLFVISALTSQSKAAERYDIVLLRGRIVDGTGAPAYIADVGIRDGRIARIGHIDENKGKTVIKAKGLIVAPGFVDMMGQSGTPLMHNSKNAMNMLTQGITTINAGEGQSAAPLNDEESKRQGWSTMAEYFQLMEIKGMPINMVQTVGHTQIRQLVLGEVARRPTAEELEKMQTYVREAMQAGAIGVSTALIYPPATYARTEEIAALVQIAGEYGGRYYTHMRNEGDLLLEAIDEAMEISREGNAPLHIFHLKAAGKQNWGKMQLAIARIKSARAAGEQITADIYPYINNGLGIAAFIHPRHFAKGKSQLLKRLDDPKLQATIRKEMETTDGWENWFGYVGFDWNKVIIGQAGERRYAEHLGKSVAEIAKEVNEDPWHTFFNLAKKGAFACPESMSNANKILAMQQPFVSFCTDVGPMSKSRSASHPRASGAFPRLLSKYVRDLGAITLERAIAQASAAAHNAILAYDRGRISEGLAADVIVFDYDKIIDNATFAKPAEFSTGMKHVIVNGQLVLHHGKMTKRLPGRVLRGPGFDEAKAADTVSTGKSNVSMVSFDQAIQRVMKKHRIPGASLAVTDHGRLVYARGYGYSDVARNELVETNSLFRIASISKPITAIGILQLVEQKKLSLDDNVYEVLGLFGTINQTPNAEKRLKEITIRHVLQHRGGWDRNMSFDAMFKPVKFARKAKVPPPAGPTEVISAMMTQPLDFDPGHRYAYSNFGYCLLGRVIEKVTGQSYEEFIKQNVLGPVGIQDMALGKTHLSGRLLNEVRYYSPQTGPSVFQANLREQVSWPYGCWHLEAMDAHGGWVASATDLARIACALDNIESSPLLSPKSMKIMANRPKGLAGYDEKGEPLSTYYSLGWKNQVASDGQVHTSHGGSLAGTRTLLLRRHDGRNIVILFNSRISPTGGDIGNLILGPINQAVEAVEEWPISDFFKTEQPAG